MIRGMAEVSMMIRFSLHSAATSIAEGVQRARRAEELGFEAMFMPDSQLRTLDPFVMASVASTKTHRLRFGTAVTNLVYRDPTVLACSAVTANEASDGRFVLGLGTGDGPVYGLGRKPTTMTRFEAGIRTIKALVNGSAVDAPTGSIRMSYDHRPVPIYLSVEGPKGLRLAGRVADGVILGSGFDLSVITWARERISEGARDAGRDPSDIEIMAAGMIAVSGDGDEARLAIRSRLANRAHHNFRFSLETVPEAERDAIKKFIQAFDITKPIEHRVPPELVTDYLVTRFAIAGNAHECIQRVRALEAAGITQMLVTPPKLSFDATMESWAAGVMTPLGAADA